MSVNTLPAKHPVQYSIGMIQDEARQLVETGIVNTHQPIYVLCQYIPAREWICVECELERCDYLLRDTIGELVSSQEWSDD